MCISKLTDKQDVDWHATREDIFASVGDDKMLMMCVLHVLPRGVYNVSLNSVVRWDTRTATEPVTKVQAHDREILAVAFSPASEHLLVTGSADKVCT